MTKIFDIITAVDHSYCHRLPGVFGPESKPVGHSLTYPFVCPRRDRIPEAVLFQSEGTQSRAEIASCLRRVADTLDAGGDITLTAGEQSVTMTPSAHPTFEVKAEREGPADTPDELSIEFEIEWAEDGDGGTAGSSGELAIE